MGGLRRLVTFVETTERASRDLVSVSARQELELTDASRVLLSNDRGWSGSGPPDIWRYESAESIRSQARLVIGPDEPYGDRTQEDMAVVHWAALRDTARSHGVVTDIEELRGLPHDVVLGPGVRAMLSAAGSGGNRP